MFPVQAHTEAAQQSSTQPSWIWDSFPTTCNWRFGWWLIIYWEQWSLSIWNRTPMSLVSKCLTIFIFEGFIFVVFWNGLLCFCVPVKTHPPSKVTAIPEEPFSNCLLIKWQHPIDDVRIKLTYQIRYCQSGSHAWSDVSVCDLSTLFIKNVSEPILVEMLNILITWGTAEVLLPLRQFCLIPTDACRTKWQLFTLWLADS